LAAALPTFGGTMPTAARGRGDRPGSAMGAPRRRSWSARRP